MDNTKKIAITINDREYKVDSGQTIMQAADKCGYHIPLACVITRSSPSRAHAGSASSRSKG